MLRAAPRASPSSPPGFGTPSMSLSTDATATSTSRSSGTSRTARAAGSPSSGRRPANGLGGSRGGGLGDGGRSGLEDVDRTSVADEAVGHDEPPGDVPALPAVERPQNVADHGQGATIGAELEPEV